MEAWAQTFWTGHVADPGVILSIVFVLPCALAAAAMLVRRGYSANVLFAFAMLAPGIALTGAYLDAGAHEQGNRVVIELDRNASPCAFTSLFMIVLGASGGFLVWLERWPSLQALWPVAAACGVILWRLLAPNTVRSRAVRALSTMRGVAPRLTSVAVSIRYRTALRGLLAGLTLPVARIAARLAPSDPRLASEPPIEVPRSNVCNDGRASGCIAPRLTAAKTVRFYRLPIRSGGSAHGGRLGTNSFRGRRHPSPSVGRYSPCR